MKIKLFVVLIAVLPVTTLKAQNENTSERLITQLKNGTAPGLLFDRSALAEKPIVATKVEQKETLVAQIRKGTAPGMKFMPATAGTAQSSIISGAQRTQAGQLASELPVKKEAVKIASPPALPTQEEVKNETPPGKQ